MGGLGPGIGGMEYLVIAVVALLVVGPERLPMLLRKLGQWVSKARGMANEFRASFDEMARQSELDDLRKEVEALRRGQSNMMPLGPEAEATFRDIRDDLNRPLDAPSPAPALTGPDEWPDSPPVLEPLEPTAKPKASRKRKAPAAAGKATATGKATPRKTTKKAAAPKTPAKDAAPAKPRARRSKAGGS
jgi:sec-independent protein translocase protein TatB